MNRLFKVSFLIASLISTVTFTSNIQRIRTILTKASSEYQLALAQVIEANTKRINHELRDESLESELKASQEKLEVVAKELNDTVKSMPSDSLSSQRQLLKTTVWLGQARLRQSSPFLTEKEIAEVLGGGIPYADVDRAEFELDFAIENCFSPLLPAKTPLEIQQTVNTALDDYIVEATGPESQSKEYKANAYLRFIQRVQIACPNAHTTIIPKSWEPTRFRKKHSRFRQEQYDPEDYYNTTINPASIEFDPYAEGKEISWLDTLRWTKCYSLPELKNPEARAK